MVRGLTADRWKRCVVAEHRRRSSTYSMHPRAARRRTPSSVKTPFGYACLGDPSSAEWGYVSLPELEEVYQPMRLTPSTPDFRIYSRVIVEREVSWSPARIAELVLRGV